MSGNDSIRKEQIKGCLTTVLFAVVGLVIVVSCGILFVISLLFTPNQNFEKWEWMSRHPCGMAQDMIDRKICMGKTPDAIKKILGEPTEPMEKQKWMYEMNDCFSMGPGRSFFVVRFGENNRVNLVEREFVND
jgi:hypothetical protein